MEREIKTISFGRAAREKRGMYLSADNTEALHLGLREIYVNSFDALTETKQKNGIVKITIDSKQKLVIVSDNGPGIPNKMRDDKIYSVVAAYTLPHTGSHFDEREVNSIGTNGIGASVVTHTASMFSVISCDGKVTAEVSFKIGPEGALVDKFNERKSNKNEQKGVLVTYTPDSILYGNKWFDYELLSNHLSEMLKFYPNIKVEFDFDGKISTFFYPKGLKETNTKIFYESDNFVLALSIGEGAIKPFGNRLYLPDGGAFYTHFKTQLTKTVNSLSGLKLSGNQIQSVFCGYTAVFVNKPLFSNQSKTAISNSEVNAEITTAIKIQFEEFSKTKEWEKVIKTLEIEMKAELAAENARQKVKGALDKINKGAKKKIIAADKLKDCIESGDNAWLAICEGKSAKGSLIKGRDIDHVALVDIRGKFINCLKNPQEKFLQNEELQMICQILGGGIFEKYSQTKLKYGKVLIAVDADEDGKNIADLLMTFFYVCMPDFIRQGRLYWMKTPLYYNEKLHKYIFTESDWGGVKNKTDFTRAKGLGELTPQVVEEALFGKYKRWEQLKPNNWGVFSSLIKTLMGDEIESRRDFIFANVDFEKIKFL